jgi:hypothetical protein
MNREEQPYVASAGEGAPDDEEEYRRTKRKREGVFDISIAAVSGTSGSLKDSSNTPGFSPGGKTATRNVVCSEVLLPSPDRRRIAVCTPS